MTEPARTFVGFGFGAIQGGLFLHEAFRSQNFKRLVVAEVVPEVVAAVRRSKGSYRVNVATRQGVEVHEVRGVEILNPSVPADARALADALADATEIATALPSVEFYQRGDPSIAALIAGALKKKADDNRLPSCVIYTAENHNHAAEILQESCERELGGRIPDGHRVFHFLNTVIGKMSGVITDASEIVAVGLARITDDLPRALLVEEFNHILISEIGMPGFIRGIEVFAENPALLPFEEAKLYGHNAVHALLGYLARRKGCHFMSDAADHPALMALAREAFLEESGVALIARHRGVDSLFTPEGYRAYAEDLLVRMTNPHLRDRIERVIRDPLRKLGWDDRLIGTMRLALDAGITPRRFALGAAAALETVETGRGVPALLEELWTAPDEPPSRKSQLIDLILEARSKLNTKEKQSWKLLMS
jgi:mannitol-1-phosphate/altronate dehydrogenase